ncbi:hypothetical protein VQ345_004778 [Salmonella enterica]|nr:hypothetical protein [Salmonella enterica]EMD4997564.1 hypothetical protein [Salmonella enterica]
MSVNLAAFIIFVRTDMGVTASQVPYDSPSFVVAYNASVEWVNRDIELVMPSLYEVAVYNYWYSVAWCAINLELDLANEVINGSNTTVNPLYYDQQGIGRLQRRALKTLRSGTG